MRTIAEIVSSARAIGETPEYQEHAARLRELHAAALERDRERDFADRCRRAHIPRRLLPLLREPLETPALVAVRDWLGTPAAHWCLVSYGDRGTGKTFAAAWGAWVTRGLYSDAQELVALSTFDASAWSDLATAPYLAIDEWGCERGNASSDAAIYALLDRRYRDGRRTLIATNLGPKEFAAALPEAYRDRLLDRIRPASGSAAAPALGASLRRSPGTP